MPSQLPLFNVARWTSSRIWDHTGEIPDEEPLNSYMKNQACWKDLSGTRIRYRATSNPSFS
jgi:hypothetical protein